MLPILCTLEPKFLKTGVTLHPQSNKPLYLLLTTEFEKSRDVPLLKKWVTDTHSVLLIISHVMAIKFKKEKHAGSTTQVKTSFLCL